MGSERSLELKVMIESMVYNCAELRSRDGAWMSTSCMSSAGLRKVLYVEPREVYLA